MPRRTGKDIKTAILDAAELLMAEHGIKGVSLRGILAAADANTASLHYHFGSREGLVKAILARHGRWTTLRRLEMLNELEARGHAPDVHTLVDAVVDPMLELLGAQGEAGRRFLRFLARLQSDRTDVHQAEEDRYFPDARERMAALLAECCSHLPQEERRRRVTMMIDTMLQSLANADFMNEQWNTDDHQDRLSEFADTLKSFLAGGLAAPVRSSVA